MVLLLPTERGESGEDADDGGGVTSSSVVDHEKEGGAREESEGPAGTVGVGAEKDKRCPPRAVARFVQRSLGCCSPSRGRLFLLLLLSALLLSLQLLLLLLLLARPQEGSLEFTP
jgi:hypothetical protein